MSQLSIGFDIGGTTSRAALINQRGMIIESTRCSTPVQLDRLLDWIADTCRAWTIAHTASTPIGLALPGVVDPATSTLVRSVNLPWLEGQPIVDQLESKIGRRPRLMTDAEAATWGEYVDFGSPATPFAHLRLGTGVACGIVVEGKLITTDSARRTHLPLLIVDESEAAALCPCGLRGCLEVFAGGDSLGRRARDLGFCDLVSLNRGYGANYDGAVKLIDHTATAVSRAIANLSGKFSVATVVLGGGVLTVVPQLFQCIRKATAESLQSTVQLHPFRLGDDAGIVGAARLACSFRSAVQG